MLTDKRCAIAFMFYVAVMLPLTASAVTPQQQNMLDQLDQLDQLDHLDFVDKDAKANTCIQDRDFSCAEKNIAAAKRFAKSSQDKESLQMTRKNLAMEQELVDSERRLRRLREEAEEQDKMARAQAIRAQEAAEEREAERQRVKYAALTAGFALGGGGQLSPERQAQIMSAIARDSQLQGGETSNFRSAVQGIKEQQSIQAQEQSNIRAQQRELRERQAQARASTEQVPAQKREQIVSVVPAADATSTDTTNRMPQIVQYVPQKVTIPSWAESCPPGSSPARNPNGTTVTAGSGAGYCIKDGSKGSSQVASTGSTENKSGNGTGSNHGSSNTSSNNDSVQSEGDKTPSKATDKKPKWGPVQLEALAICRQNKESQKWECNGALDNQNIVDEPTVESALARQHCAGGTPTVGSPVIKGVQWQVYQCGHSLGAGDYDVAKRYNLVTPRRSYICKANSSQRCSTPYTGQDKIR
ncbi:MAG: hypothetical protein I8H81_03135 [Pseudomonadales bacterium]|nr:hypothetical protein [Pseudomonadales bacterium]MBH2076202.1 hypothetical protein [Pseudomonadales bacterium]